MRPRKKVKKQKIFKIAFPTTFILRPFGLKRPLLPQMPIENEQFQHFIRQIKTKLIIFFLNCPLKMGHLCGKSRSHFTAKGHKIKVV